MHVQSLVYELAACMYLIHAACVILRGNVFPANVLGGVKRLC